MTILRCVFLAACFLVIHACSGLGSTNSINAASGWALNNSKSALSFVSIKKNSIAEVHRFDALSGSLSSQGPAQAQAQVSINLASVNTGIEIRNQRMIEHLFEVRKFASASVIVALRDIHFAQLAPGESVQATVNAKLQLHGVSQTLPVAVSVLGLSNGGIQVDASKPVVVNAAEFELSQGVAKLAELAGLPTIASAIPVSFNLVFDPV